MAEWTNDPNMNRVRQPAILSPHATVPPREAALAVTAGFLGWTLDAFDFFLVIIAVPAIAVDLKVGQSSIFAAVTLTLVFRPVGAFLFGLLADRYGRRIPMMINLLFFAAIEVATAFAPNITVFMFSGPCSASAWEANGASARRWSWRRCRPGGVRLSGLLQEGYAVGYLLAAVAAYFILEPYGWRTMFLLGGAPALLAVFVRVFVKESEVWRTTKAESWSQLGRGIVRHWKLWVYLTILMAMMNFSSHGTQDSYPTFMKDFRGLKPSAYSQIVIVMMIGALLGGVLFGLASDRFGRRRMMIAALAGALVVVPLWAFSSQMVWIVTGAVLMQFMVQGAGASFRRTSANCRPIRSAAFCPASPISVGICWPPRSLGSSRAWPTSLRIRRSWPRPRR